MPMEKTFDATEAEARIYAAWEQAGAFRAGANAAPKADGSPAETFCIMIPPPNVTGSLHMGHAFNNTLQDILVRWHRMRGFDTLWQPGQDHAGIATQMVVERELARTGQPPRRKMKREAFVAKVWEQKQKSGNTIIDQLKRLGASCDWSRNAFTMSGAPGAPAGEEGNFHNAVIKVFVEMYNHKDSDGNPDPLIYRGKRLVNWDPHFETAISDLEVENIEVDGHMWHFKYPLAANPETGEPETYEYVERDEAGRVTLRERRDYISIATTRPETMLGDGAVAVHPSDERYAGIVGKLCEIPVGPKAQRRLIPIITDEYPDKTFGSGAVKITGAHDFNDYQVAKRGNIPMYALMDTRGRMRADGRPYAEEAAIAQRIAAGAEAFDEASIAAMNLVPDEYRGLDRFEARARVVADITAEGLAVTVLHKSIDPETGAEHLERVPLVEAKKIMQPFGDRSKVVIEPMLTDQWFVDTAKIVQPAIDAVRDGRTRILPAQHEKVYFNWLENIEPWCISRQLWWGHRVPVWYGPKKNEDGSLRNDGSFESFCASDEAAAEQLAKKYYGGEARIRIAMFDGALPHIVGQRDKILVGVGAEPVPGTKGHDFQDIILLTRDPDVLDTWFSSGIWPIGTLGWPDETPELQKYFPTSTLVTGFDIIFFWVARMMMMQLELVGQVPFREVYVHALVRDEKGKKMSKSLGNVLDPLDLIDEYGADAVRFTLTAMAAMGRDLKLSTQRIAGYRNFGTKLWNATRFAEMNGVFEGAGGLGIPTPTHTVNRWIIGETARVREAVDAAFADYRFNDAAQALYGFVWGRVCDWYVEFSKPLMDGDLAPETRATMRWVLDQCFVLLHPIMPFITEELWSLTATRPEPLVHATWPDYGAALIDAEADREMNWVIRLIEEIRSARAQMHIPAGLKLQILRLESRPEQNLWLARNMLLVERLARVYGMNVVVPPTDGSDYLDSFAYGGNAPKGWINIPMDGASFAIKVDGIDIPAEISRLSKTMDKLAKEIAGLKGRLNNPNFVASAPEEVVEETRENLTLGEEEAGKLRVALARLADLD